MGNCSDFFNDSPSGMALANDSIVAFCHATLTYSTEDKQMNRRMTLKVGLGVTFAMLVGCFTWVGMGLINEKHQVSNPDNTAVAYGWGYYSNYYNRLGLGGLGGYGNYYRGYGYSPYGGYGSGYYSNYYGGAGYGRYGYSPYYGGYSWW